jgi:hypothetical protein
MGRVETVTSVQDVERGSLQSGNHNQSQSEMRKFLPSEYHDRFVRNNLLHRPWLDILDQFMDPNSNEYAVNLERRMLDFDITVIHISKSGDVESPIKCPNPIKFKDAISETEQERSGTLIITKGISRDMIDSLGMKYELEPEFFASHLEGTESYRQGLWKSPTVKPPPRAPHLLPSYLRKAAFYTAQYRRPYHIEGGMDELIRLRSSETNTPRGIHVLARDIPDVFAAEKISIYRKSGSNIGKLEGIIISVVLNESLNI